MTSSKPRKIAFQLGTILLAAPTLIALLEGVLALQRLEARREEAIEAGSWAIAYAPPVWLQALFLAAALSLGLFLALRAGHRPAGRRVAVIVLLLCASQSIFFNVEVWTIWGLEWWSENLRPGWPTWLTILYLRVTGPLVNLLWPPAWFFAAAAFVGFTLWFPNPLTTDELLANPPRRALRWRARRRQRPARLRRIGRGEAGLALACSSWLVLYGAFPDATWYRAAGGILALCGLAWAALGRWRRGAVSPAATGSVGPAAPLAPRTAGWLLMVSATAVGLAALASPPRLALWVGLAIAFVRSRQVTATLRYAAWVVPVGLAIAVVAGEVIWYALPWLGLALIDGLRFLRLNIRSATRDERRKVLWLQTAFVLASTTAILWAGAVFLGRALDCAGPGPAVFCRFVAVQDWFLLLPLPLLTGLLAVAVLYSGAIDADLVLKRTAAFSGVAMLVAFLFGVLEHWLSRLFVPELPQGAATVVSAGIIALVMHPLKVRCDRGAAWTIRLLVGDPSSDGAPSGEGQGLE